MSDIVRMLRVSESDPVQQEAADYIEHQIASHEVMTQEIERLRADCAKLETAHGQNMREISRLRAELAAALNALAAERTLREHETKRANDNYESLTKHWLKEGNLRELLAEIIDYRGGADHALADE